MVGRARFLRPSRSRRPAVPGVGGTIEGTQTTQDWCWKDKIVYGTMECKECEGGKEGVELVFDWHQTCTCIPTAVEEDCPNSNLPWCYPGDIEQREGGKCGSGEDSPDQRRFFMFWKTREYPCEDIVEATETTQEIRRGQECNLNDTSSVKVCVPWSKLRFTINSNVSWDEGVITGGQEGTAFDNAMKDCGVKRAKDDEGNIAYGPLTQEQEDCLHGKICCPKEGAHEAINTAAAQALALMAEEIRLQIPYRPCQQSQRESFI